MVQEQPELTPESSGPKSANWRIIRYDHAIPKKLISKMQAFLKGTTDLEACFIFQISEPGKDPEPALGFLYPKPISPEEFEVISKELLNHCLEDMQTMGQFFQAVMIGPDRSDEVANNGVLVYTRKKTAGLFMDIGTFVILGGILIAIIVGGFLLWKQFSKPKPEPLPPPPPPVEEIVEEPAGPPEVVESEPNTFTNVDPAEDAALEASKDCKNITTIIEGTTIREICND